MISTFRASARLSAFFAAGLAWSYFHAPDSRASTFQAQHNAWNKTDYWKSVSGSGAPGSPMGASVWTGSVMLFWGGGEGSPASLGYKYDPISDSWTAMTTTGVPTGRHRHSMVWTGSEAMVWGGCGNSACGNAMIQATGGSYDPVGDTWATINTSGAPMKRFYHSAVWTGSAMLIWGGCVGSNCSPGSDGGSYNGATWTALTTIGAPSARLRHHAIWTGSKMLIWGGDTNTTCGGFPLNTGAHYDPGANSWTSITTINAPSPRSCGTAVWAGDDGKMIAFGGIASGTPMNTGALYHPATDSWTATTTVNAPAPRGEQAAVWTGRRMVIWGGFGGSYFDTGAVYDYKLNLWRKSTSLRNAPSSRKRPFAVWADNQMVIWGGFDGTELLDGGRYRP